MNSDFRRICQGARKVVVKIGTSLLATQRCGINMRRLRKFAGQMAAMRQRAVQVVVVSSGAICAGMQRLGFKERPYSMPDKQAAAAVGQGLLMKAYDEAFGKHHIVVGQILLTQEDFSSRIRYSNAYHTIRILLKQGVIPVINENDSVAVDEIRFGDNDTLSAQVASLIEADLLVILSDVEGLYTEDPRYVKNGSLIEEVHEITASMERVSKKAGTKNSVGGMYTKIRAARIATQAGVATLIANGTTENILIGILNGERLGTLFVPASPGGKRLGARKRWIAFTLKSKGSVIVDDGARQALLKGGKSLLPSGIIKVTGSFKYGDAVTLVDTSGKQLAKGLANYSAAEMDAIKGLRTTEIEKRLGSKEYDEAIHRDNMVIL